MQHDIYDFKNKTLDYIIICITALLRSALTLFSGFGLGILLVPVFAIFFPIEIRTMQPHEKTFNFIRPHPSPLTTRQADRGQF